MVYESEDVRNKRETNVIGLEFELMPNDVRGVMREMPVEKNRARIIYLNGLDSKSRKLETIRRLYESKSMDPDGVVRTRVIRD